VQSFLKATIVIIKLVFLKNPFKTKFTFFKEPNNLKQKVRRNKKLSASELDLCFVIECV
jgi:hypothetical protein